MREENLESQRAWESVVKLHIDQLADSELAISAGQDIPDLLATRARQYPNKTFLVWEPFDGEPEKWSYSEFQNKVVQLAGGLHERGIEFGDKVLLHMDNCPEFLFSWFACARLGAVAVSTNTRSVARDLSYFVEKAGTVCALTQPNFEKLIHEAAPGLHFVAVTNGGSDKSLGFDSLFSESIRAPERAIDPRADLSIQFTSGTTSRPKAVLWTHANAVLAARLNVQLWRVGPEDVSLAHLPLFHTNAQCYSMLTSLQVGGTLVVQPKFSASRFWDVSLRNGCTWTSMIVFSINAIMDQEVPKENQYRFWSIGARVIPWEEHFGIETLPLWGMTETVSPGIFGDRDDPGPNLNIGRVSPDFEIEVRRESGELVEPGETGALYVRGTRGLRLFKEYFRDPEKTAESFDSDGWFDTGDLVKLDVDGRLYFQDRAKDMLRVGAENVAASEIEEIIFGTGLVSECAVVGQKHYMLDEVPVAFVIPLAGTEADIAETIIAACKTQLPDFKVVREVHVVDELPRSTLNKIAKNELRAQLPEITE